ncbi:uncharacterized protein K02A2.6-like [Toxorhynchites rutilus septentrionalis]|uniref:uncharacterized protein K02A2.6-like n=1 Tax=Toxorhynchites rutilus septentrionalis TaxID=329112 RepID=UPI002479F8ED|nr:uncharacterized protein K02A2.6-like [Toxorhynchites rutilus septentrionalis]
MEEQQQQQASGVNSLGQGQNGHHQQQHPPPQQQLPPHQQQHPLPPQQHPAPLHNQPQLGLPHDALILQILQQLQHQQAITNQLLQQQRESQQQQQQGAFQQQQEIFRSAMQSIQVNVPPNPEIILDSLAANIKEFLYDPETHSTFGSWFARYEDLFAKDAERIDDSAKVRLLLRRLGTQEHYRYVSYILPNTPKNFSFLETVEKLRGLFGTKESAVKKRYSTLTITKSPTEDYVSYACRVNKMCVEFELSKMSEAQFKCLMFVCGLKSERDSEVRMRLLSKIEDSNNATLDTLIEECQRLMNLKSDTAMIENPVPSTVQAIKGNQQHRKTFKKPFDNQRSYQQQQHQQRKSGPASPCWNCGAMHYAKECSFINHKCSSCNQSGHKEGYCSSAKRSAKRRKPYNKQFSTKTVVSVNSVQGKRRFVWVKLNDIPVRLQLDTASDITIVSKQIWERIGRPAAVPTVQSAKTASGEDLRLEFEFSCTVSLNESVSTGHIYVSNNSLNLLGIDFIDKLNLWSLPMNKFCNLVSGEGPIDAASLQRDYPRLFSSTLGLCTKTKVSLALKEACKPVFRPKRPVSYAMLPIVDAELNRLEGLNIISPVDFSEWAAPIVVVRKSNGSIRICGDYSTGLNDRLLPHQYPLPLPQDIFSKLTGCTVFSQIDLSDAFLQMEVDESSRKLLTVNTHRGLYQYNRLPPGVKAAPGAFQQMIDIMLAGLSFTSGYLDDVVVGGRTPEEHQQNLHAVLQRIQEFGFTIRPEKCSFGREQLGYLGLLLDKDGLRPDPNKIKAIQDMPPPRDLTGVRSFLGAVNYYGKFVPNMRSLRYPLDELLKTSSPFKWTKEYQKAFDDFKAILSSDLLLAHYDPQREIVVAADASSIGIGATISHKYPDGKMKVIQHASRALTSTEQKYSQPDREGLAIVFAVTKFHKFIFGRRFRLQTDHAPLLRIFGSKKGIPVYTANRLQRWALTLLSYDFSMEYVATDKFGNADVLSRLIDQHIKPNEDFVVACTNLEEELKSVANSTISQLPLSFRMVEQATNSDPVLRKVYRFIKHGWPKNRAEIKDQELLRYYDRQEALSIVEGSIMFSDRLVIPALYRKRCLNQLHKGHPGVQRMKAIARSFVYWPCMDDEITSYVRACNSCASVARSPPKATPVPWPKPTVPWQRIHVDYAGPLEGEYYLIVVDAYSKWPEILPTKSITAKATINLLRSVFTNKGMPEVLVSDNGTQFTSAEFKEFCVENGVEHMTTAPFHPQSNGQAERFVDTFKRAVRKIQEGEVSIRMALDTFLLTYRTTPNLNTPNGRSPAELMYNRRLRTSLELLRVPHNQAQPMQTDANPQSRSFVPKDTVYAKVYINNKWTWAPGTVVERIDCVMYNVWVDNRKLIRSHINQLKSRGAMTHQGSKKQSIPLDILLSECDVNTPAAMRTPIQDTPSLEHRLEPSDRVSSSLKSFPLPNETNSSCSTATSSTTAAESLPVVQAPRRSSRVRRAPQWFNAYQRI